MIDIYDIVTKAANSANPPRDMTFPRVPRKAVKAFEERAFGHVWLAPYHKRTGDWRHYQYMGIRISVEIMNEVDQVSETLARYGES